MKHHSSDEKAIASGYCGFFIPKLLSIFHDGKS
jgi:hypothetical protein